MHHGSKNDPDLARRRVPSPYTFSISADLKARCFVTPKRFHHGESAGMQVAQFFAVLKESRNIDTELRLPLESYLGCPGYGDEPSERHKRNQA